MRKNAMVLILCLLFFSTAVLKGQDAKHPQPTTVPGWLMKNGRFLFGEERSVGGVSAEKAAACGANILCGGTNAGSPGFAGGPYLWDGKDRIYNMWTDEDVDVAAIRAKVDEAHRLGLKVIGELMRMWHQEMLYVKHPEWQELSKPDRVPRGPEKKKEWPPVTGCWNSPFGDFYIEHSVRLAQALGWDGISLDGFGNWRCFCPSCRESYKQETGLEIPWEDVNDPQWRRFIQWRLERYDRFVDRWQRALKAVNPEFALIPWSTGPGRWWHWSFSPKIELSDYANRLVDAPMVELFWDFPPDQGSNLMPDLTVRYYAGLTAGRPVFMLPYFCTQGQQPMVAPPVECDFRVLTVLANGARPVMSSHQLGRDKPLEQLRHLNGLIQDREPWTLDAKPLKWAAMLMSESSRIFYGLPGYKGEHGFSWIGSGVDSGDSGDVPPCERRLPAHMESAAGVFRAVLEEHLPIDIITDADLEGGATALDDYRVLILPNAAGISDDAAGAMERFVTRGGGVAAINQTSLMDSVGDRRNDLALIGLLGVQYEGSANHTARWPDYPHPIFVGLLDHAITRDPVIAGNYRVEMQTLDYIGLCTDVRITGNAQAVAYRGPSDKVTEQIRTGSAGSNRGELPEGVKPFLVLNQAEKGRSVYFAADIGQSYFVTPYPYERKLLVNAIRWAAGSAGPSVLVEAPMCIAATFYQREGGKQVIVHLLNELNTTTNRALPEGNSSMREEVIPVSGIGVVFQDPLIRKATLQPENISLKLTETAAGMRVEVPPIKLHSMVVAEK